MNNVFIRAILLITVIVSFVGQVQAQDSMTISGHVSLNGGIGSGLDVTLNRVADEQVTRITSTVTDSSGTYRFETVPGDYLVNVSFKDSTHHSMVSPQNPVADFDFSGNIEGWVIHAGGKDVSGIPVNLRSSSNTVCASTTTDGSGHYTFANVDLSVHRVQAEYMYVGYSSENVTVNRISTIANITIYDSTILDTNIRTVADHIVIGQDMNGPWVQEYIQFVNMGNTSYYGPDGVDVGIGIPLMIKDLQTDIMDCCLVREDKRLWVDPMEPLLPGGTTEATISYYLDTDEKEFVFEKDILYPSSYLMVFGDSDSGIDLTSQATATDTENMDGRNYDVLRFAHPGPGDTIVFTVRGYTLPGRNSPDTTDWIVYLGLGFFIITMLAYPVISKRGRDKTGRPVRRSGNMDRVLEPCESDVSHMSRKELEDEKLRIFEKLRILDNKLEKGEILEDEYDEYRSEYKSAALEIINFLKEMGTEEEESLSVERTPGIDLSHTVKEIQSRIQDIDDVALLEKTIEQEINGKNRKTLMNTMNKRIDELQKE
ncbi:MAG: hypothetical protein K0A89_11465 [ANME-2 cluster archaeon]|nr:hypothetical protein [ANME-2 cluster archaeon]